MRRQRPNEARTATRNVTTITVLRSASDQLPVSSAICGIMRPNTMVVTVKMACTSTGNAPSTMMVFPAMAPFTVVLPHPVRTAPPAGSAYRRRESRPLPRATSAPVTRLGAPSPHVELVPIEFVGDLSLLGGALQRLPVMTEYFASGRVCHDKRTQQVEDHTHNSASRLIWCRWKPPETGHFLTAGSGKNRVGAIVVEGRQPWEAIRRSRRLPPRSTTPISRA